jgi:hypothetical protein
MTISFGWVERYGRSSPEEAASDVPWPPASSPAGGRYVVDDLAVNGEARQPDTRRVVPLAALPGSRAVRTSMSKRHRRPRIERHACGHDEDRVETSWTDDTAVLPGIVMSRGGIEPPTRSLKGCCSTD